MDARAGDKLLDSKPIDSVPPDNMPPDSKKRSIADSGAGQSREAKANAALPGPGTRRLPSVLPCAPSCDGRFARHGLPAKCVDAHPRDIGMAASRVGYSPEEDVRPL
jgi:hypothetical protein